MTIQCNPERFALGDVHVKEDDIAIQSNYGVDLNFEDYSRFKYGDGAISRTYGGAIARHLIPLCVEVGERDDLYVTSSAYKIAQPAAASLVEPFVGVAQAVAHAHGARSRIVPIKINRANLTDGDYASMSAEQRDEVMRRNGLSLPKGVNIEGQRIVALDDIRVTGSHEVSLDAVLRNNGAEEITHAYILDVVDGKSDPTLEARINKSSVNDIDDLIGIASLKHFMANARFGKRILTESPQDIKKFVDSMSMRITSRIINDAIGDGLDEMDRYKKGYDALLDAFSERVIHMYD